MEGYQEMEFGKENENILIKLLDEPFEKNSVGMVESDLFEGRVVVLFVDFRTEDERDYDHAGLSYTNNKDVGRVYMTERVFRGLKQRNPMETAIVLHELGHFYHQHQPIGDKDKLFEVRMLPVKSGNVYKDEKEADEFAAKFIGYKAVADGLEQMNREDLARYSTGEYNPEEVELSTKEVELRIQNLRSKQKD